MSGPVAFVGDALTAAGYRLAGATVYVPPEGEEAEAFERARQDAKIVLVAMDTALRIPLARLDAALAALAPLVLIVPDADDRPSPVDPARRVRRQLGIES